MRNFVFCVCLLASVPVALHAQERSVTVVRRSFTIAPQNDSSLRERAAVLPSISRGKRALAGAIVGGAIGFYVGYKYGQHEANCGGDVDCGDPEMKDAIIGGLFGGFIGATVLADRVPVPLSNVTSFRVAPKRLGIFHSVRF